MANPQPTDAHLRIAHSILEQIMVSDFTKRRLSILLFVLRLSWGCGKKEALIPRQSDFGLVGVESGHVKAELDWLEENKVIYRNGNFYSFNKNYDEWRVSRAKLYRQSLFTEMVSLNLPKREKTDYHYGNIPVPSSGTPKESLYKVLNKDIYSEDKKAQGLWQNTLDRLRLEVTRSFYRTWLAKTTGISYKENVFVVGVPNAFVAEHLEQNQRSLIEKTLIGLTKPGVKIEFAIWEDEA